MDSLAVSFFLNSKTLFSFFFIFFPCFEEEKYFFVFSFVKKGFKICFCTWSRKRGSEMVCPTPSILSLDTNLTWWLLAPRKRHPPSPSHIYTSCISLAVIFFFGRLANTCQTLQGHCPLSKYKDLFLLTPYCFQNRALVTQCLSQSQINLRAREEILYGKVQERPTKPLHD